MDKKKDETSSLNEVVAKYFDKKLFEYFSRTPRFFPPTAYKPLNRWQKFYYPIRNWGSDKLHLLLLLLGLKKDDDWY